jgi:hypothetical protein
MQCSQADFNSLLSTKTALHADANVDAIASGAKGCLSGFLGLGGVNEDCMVPKMQDTFGVTPPCARCFAQSAVCGFANCKMACALGGPKSDRCANCIDQHCSAALTHCVTGL